MPSGYGKTANDCRTPGSFASFRGGECEQLEGQPAALLTESLSQPVGDDGGGFGVELADLVAAVVVLGLGEIGVAALGLAPGRVDDGAVLGRSGPAVEPVHEVVLGREVRTAAEVEPNSRGDVHGWADVLALRYQYEPLVARDRRVQGEHGVVTVVVVRRRVGRRAGEDVRVEERVDLVGLGLVEMVSE